MSATMTTTTDPSSRTKRIRSHLSSWVMLSPATNPPYTPLPHETTLFTSPPRIGFALSTPSSHNTYPGSIKHQQSPPFSLTHSSGILYLTNRRFIYLPDKSTDKLQSFAAPILNLHDSHVTAPFFGPNVWTALLQPVAGGGIPAPAATGGVVEIKLTFKEGGAFDFHTQFERVKERLQQAVEVSRMGGGGDGGVGAGSSSSRAAMNGVDVRNVHSDDLPAYQERGDGPLLAPVLSPVPVQVVSPQRDSGVGVVEEEERPPPKPRDEGFAAPPDEPPPGYEEAQMQGLHDEVERRLSGGR